MEKAKDSKTLMDLWEIKKSIARNVEQLELSDAIHRLLTEARESTRKYYSSRNEEKQRRSA